MGEAPTTAETLREVFRTIRHRWRPVLLTGLAYKLLAFAVLTPIASLAFRLFVGYSGHTVLSGEDILLFFVSPVGGLCAITVGALWLAILVLEQAALLHVLYHRGSRGVGVLLAAIGFALAHGREILGLTLRLVAKSLLVTLPFAATAGLLYWLLLTEYDINYYLAEKPPVFLVAIGCGALIVSGLAVVLLRLISVWLFALPVLLFANEDVKRSLRTSYLLAQGQRLRLVGWLIGWWLGSVVLSTLVSSLAGLLGKLVLVNVPASIGWLLVAVGAMLTGWTLLSFVLSLTGTTVFASILMTLYRESCSGHAELVLAEQSEDVESPYPLTWRRLLAVAVVGIMTSAAVGAVTLSTIRLEDNTLITAHRGASAVAPENTLAAIRAAIADRADFAEIDVQESADGEVVVMHDSDFKKTAGSELKIWDATREDLDRLDIGSWFAADFRDERVPSLEDVLTECKGRIKVNIELKYYGHDQQLESRVVQLVESHDMQSEIVIMSLNPAAVAKVRELRPSWTVGLLTPVAIGDLTRVDVDFLAVSAGMASNRFIDEAQRNGKQVHVWTVNDPVTMSTMIGRGADHLITDKPALARSVLQQRAELGAPERLLLAVAELFGLPTKFAEQ